MISGERFARLVTTLVVGRPALWPLLRGRVQRLFDELADEWDARRTPGALAPLEAALAYLPAAPRRALDVGTGTGAAAFAVARRWPEAEVVGVDLSERMIAEARRKVPTALAERVSFDVADAASLPYPDASFDLVTLANMLPFFDELQRATTVGGHVVFAFSRGRETPIYVPLQRLRRELAPRGFGDFRDVAAGDGEALLARRVESR